MLSGFTPDKKSIDQVIRWNNFIMWSETQTDKVTFYLSELGRHPVNFSFMVEQEVLVKNLRPAIVKVYDYYEPDEDTGNIIQGVEAPRYIRDP
ncbi:hypothetical protein XENTR_v10017617 [Xenopus tropicalis]|nr:hypothetical protein XENTR_v10017617 [Xenopus tropicalis]